MQLPLEVRFLLENVYIVGTTPIPNAPDPFSISHIVQYIVNMVQRVSGSAIATHRHPQGIPVGTRIIPVIADLQAIRKFAGFKAHSATMFCWYCLCTNSEKERLDWKIWTYRDGNTVRNQADEWHKKKWISEKEELAKKTGVRWTPMHELHYWDPVMHVLLGIMHNSLEGILAHQLRTLWGIGRKNLPLKNPDLDVAEEGFTDVDISESGSELSDLEEEAREHMRSTSTGLTEKLDSVMFDDFSGDEDTPTPPQKHPNLQPNNDSDEDEDPDYKDIEPDNVFNFTSEELGAIRLCIQEVALPTWVARPPTNLGEASHGKLKADEYLVLFTVILPHVLPVLWWNKGNKEHQLFDSFYHLITSINIICSFSTSDVEADAYMEAYVKYRKSIQDLFPYYPSKPNHHYAMHNGKLLKFWGPLATLSEFPGERLNGLMQKVKTSHRTSK